MENEYIVPLVVSDEDTKPIEKPHKAKPDPEIEIKFHYGKNGVIVAIGPNGEKRVVPSTFQLRLVYPTKIKISLWNTFIEWKK